MTFKRSSGREFKPPTDAQKTARARSFLIFRLRGLYYHAWILTGERREQMAALVDAELAALGVESQTARIERKKVECAAKYRRWEMIDKMERGIRIP